jgi:hypothetical protein
MAETTPDQTTGNRRIQFDIKHMDAWGNTYHLPVCFDKSPITIQPFWTGGLCNGTIVAPQFRPAG